MKLVRQSFLVTTVLLLMAVSFTGSAFADWAATLVWKKEIGGCGVLQFCDDGPYLRTYENTSEGNELREIEFFDWNGDPTGVTLNFTGLTQALAYFHEGPVIGVESSDDSLRVTRFATYDRSGTMLFEISDQDSLRSIVGFMVSGSGRFHEWKHMGYLEEQFKIFEPDGTLLCTMTCDSVHSAGLSQDGQRFYVEGGDRGRMPGAGPADFYLRTYSVDGCSVMYTLPKHYGILMDSARDVDVVAQWIDSTLTVYSGGISQGTLGNTVAFTLSPSGGYLVGHTQAADRIRLFRLDTMTQIWEILDEDDVGDQMPIPDVANNGVVLYVRELSEESMGVTVVSPDGAVLHEEDFTTGTSWYLDGDGEFFLVQDCATDSLSYYTITE